MGYGGQILIDWVSRAPPPCWSGTLNIYQYYGEYHSWRVVKAYHRLGAHGNQNSGHVWFITWETHSQRPYQQEAARVPCAPSQLKHECPRLMNHQPGALLYYHKEYLLGDFSHIKYSCKKLLVRKWRQIPNFTAFVIHALLNFVTHASLIAWKDSLMSARL